MKRVLIGLGVLFLLLFLLVGGLAISVFGGNQTLADLDLPGGARLVKDGYVAINFLPSGPNEVVLIDCGNDAEGTVLLAELKRRGLGPEAVKAVFLTHGHPDHIAACHLLPKAEIYAFAGDVGLAAGTARSKGPIPSMLDIPVEKRIKVTHELKDGEDVVIGNLTVRAFSVPGHTVGSAVFLARRVLYMGDNATGGSNGEIKAAPWVFSDDTAENRRSLVTLAGRVKTLTATVVEEIAFAHSGPLKGFDALARFKAE